MKKLLAILLAVIVSACVFAGCSKNENKGDDKTTTTTNASNWTTLEEIKEAAIIQSDAINLIKSYSAEELSLTKKEKKNCSFMFSNNAHEIDGVKCVQVIATVKEEHKNDKGEVSYTFDNKGEYYISFDGKQMFKKDMKSGKYEKMEVKPVPTTEAAETEHDHDHDHD